MRLSAAALAALALAGCGGNDPEPAATSSARTGAATTEAPPLEPFLVGAVDDAVRHDGPALERLREAGFRAAGITSFWQPGLSAPTAEELATLRGVAERAADTRIFLGVYHTGSATTPLTSAARQQFADYVRAIVRDVPEIEDVIVGNEPNLNRFWMPQFGPDGSDVAAPAYFELLAAVHDAVEAERPEARIWGGALAPRGVDRPGTGRDTQSPTRFIRDLGAAYRASGRETPPLDGFAYHPYPASSSIPPDRPTHPDSRSILLADYEEKLRPLLDEAFGPGLPVLYSELGVETRIPEERLGAYTGSEVGAPVDEATQANYYRRAIELGACQDGVEGILLFHSQDEPALEGFQSGVHYADGGRKASFAPVRQAAERTICP